MAKRKATPQKKTTGGIKSMRRVPANAVVWIPGQALEPEFKQLVDAQVKLKIREMEQPTQVTNAEPHTVETVTPKIFGLLGSLGHDDQNKVVAALFSAFLQARRNRLNDESRQLVAAREREQWAEKSLRDLENIGAGLFSIIGK